MIVTRSKGKSSSNKNLSPPKRPPTAYILYMKDYKERFHIEEKEDIINLNRIVSEAYKRCPDETKQEYQDKAMELRKEYDKEVKAYVANYGPLPKSGKKSPEKEKDEEKKSIKKAKKYKR